jgi:hypothetical protein
MGRSNFKISTASRAISANPSTNPIAIGPSNPARTQAHSTSRQAPSSTKPIDSTKNDAWKGLAKGRELVSEGFKQLDLRRGEGTHLGATGVKGANDFSLLAKGNYQESAQRAREHE